MKFSNTKSAFNSAKHRRMKHMNNNSCDSRWDSDTHTVLHTVKPKKHKKLTSNEKLEGIFRIYNMKDMAAKIQPLRKLAPNDNIRVANFHDTEFDENSYNDYDYDNSSAFLSKLEGKTKRMNQTMYGNRMKGKKQVQEMAEVESHFESTPNTSYKHVASNGELSPLKESRLESSCSSFRDSWARNAQTETKKKIGVKSQHTIKARRVIHAYLQKDTMRQPGRLSIIVKIKIQ